MKKGKLWLVIISMLLLTTLGACTSGGTKNTASSNSSKSEKIKITYWHRMTGSYEKELNKLIKNFNDSQDKYEVTGTSQGSYVTLQQKLMAAAKSNTLPTISQTPYTNIGDYVKNGLILPLDDYLLKGSDKLTEDDQADLYTSFMDTAQYKGHYYTVPFSKSVRLLFYNKDLMDKYNIQIPKTWADFKTVAQKLKGTSIKAVTFDKSYDMELEGLAYSAGTPLISKNLKPQLDSKAAFAAGNLITGMINDGTAKAAGEDNYFSVPFAQSNTVFGIGSSATIPTLMSQAPSTMHWGTAEVPTYQGKTATALAGNDIALFKGATKDQQKGAWLFMKYLISKKATAEWSMASGYLPVRKSVLDDKEYKVYLEKNPQYKAATEASDNAFSSAVFPGYGDYRNDLMTAVDDTLTKEVTFDNAFKKLQAQTLVVMKDNEN